MATTDSSVTTPPRLRALPAVDRIALLLVALGGTAIRLWYQHGRCFDGDEVGTLVHLQRGYGELLTTFRDPWLTMNAYIVMVKALSQASHGNPWVMLLPTLLAGVAIVPLTAAVALRLAGRTAAVGAACFAATNPFLVLYGVQLRSYMLLAAATTAALVAYLDWRVTRAGRDAWGCAVATAFAVLMHANGVYFVAFLGVLLVADVVNDRRGWAAGFVASRGLIVPLVLALLPVAASYWPLRHDMAEFRAFWSAPAPTSVGYVPWVVSTYLGRGAAVLPSLVLLGWCLWDASRRRAPVLCAAVGVIVPVIAASFLGVSHFPWAYARFFIAVVPLLLVLLATGAATLPGGAIVRGTAIVLVIASWTPRLLALHHHDLSRPWDRIGAHLATTTVAADLLVSTDDGDTHAALDLGPHLDPNGARFGSPADWIKAEAPARLVLVNPNAPLAVAAPARTIGAVQIVVWNGPSRAGVVEQAAADLEQALQRRIAPDLSGAYRLLLDLRGVLGRPDADGDLTALRYECLMRTRRQRYKPPQLLGLPADYDGP